MQTKALRLIKGNHPVRLSGAEIKALTAERVARRMRKTERLTKANVYRMAAGAGTAVLPLPCRTGSRPSPWA